VPDDPAKIEAAIFEVLHAPPSAFNINRTSWRLADLKRVLQSEKGVRVSKSAISSIIQAAGFRWRKARKVLTSTDPNYREKLDRMTCPRFMYQPL
jgi:transposase